MEKTVDINKILVLLRGSILTERKQKRVVALNPGFYESISKAFSFMKARKDELGNEGRVDEFMKTMVLENTLKKEFSYFMQVRMSKILQYSVYGNAGEYDLTGPEIYWFRDANQLYREAISKIQGDSQ